MGLSRFGSATGVRGAGWLLMEGVGGLRFVFVRILP
jgi:hypothetical protein